jgi:histidine triad (HIT) family protein
MTLSFKPGLMMDCLFCNIACGETPANLIYENESVVAFQDINPQAPVHFLIIPREHIATANDIQPGSTIIAELYEAAQVLARDLGIDETGYRLVMNCNGEGGQEVYHIHLHLLGGRQMEWPPG